MQNNKWLLILEDDLNKKDEKKYLELNNDIDEFSLLENILMDLYEEHYIDMTCDKYLDKNIPKDDYKRRIMGVNEISLIIKRNFEDVLIIEENIKLLKSYPKIKKINLTDLYNLNEKNNLNYWILKLTEHGVSSRNHIYFKIPSNITYNEIFKNIINIIEIYNNNFKLNDEIYSDYITIEQIKHIVISLFNYEIIEPKNMLRDDNEYNNRIKIMNLSNIRGRETGNRVEKYIDMDLIKNSDIYFNRIDGQEEVREKDESNPIEDIVFPDEDIIQNKIYKVVREIKNKFDKYEIIANGRLIRIILGKEQDLFFPKEEYIKGLNELFLLAPSIESSHSIFCYMVYIIEIYKNLTSKTIKAPMLQLLLNKLFGLKILSKNDKTSRIIVASEYFSDYTCETSIKELIKYSDDFKDSLEVNKRNKEEDILIISEIISIKNSNTFLY